LFCSTLSIVGQVDKTLRITLEFDENENKKTTFPYFGIVALKKLMEKQRV
jgi:hypothetical protein